MQTNQNTERMRCLIKQKLSLICNKHTLDKLMKEFEDKAYVILEKLDCSNNDNIYALALFVESKSVLEITKKNPN